MSVIAQRPACAPFRRLPFTRACAGAPPRQWLRPLQRSERLLELSRQAALCERSRLLGDLHDGCGGQLVSALRLAQCASPPERIAAALRDCIDDLRITLDGLDPDCGDLGPLLAAQRDRMESRLEGQSLHLEWRVDLSADLRPAAADHGLHLLRILQEAFTNVLKHAQASTVQVQGTVLPGAPRCLCLRVRDNGTGLRGGHRGRGLASMRRRAALMGAALTVRSGDGLQGTGTEVELCLPLAAGGC